MSTWALNWIINAVVALGWVGATVLVVLTMRPVLRQYEAWKATGETGIPPLPPTVRSLLLLVIVVAMAWFTMTGQYVLRPQIGPLDNTTQERTRDVQREVVPTVESTPRVSIDDKVDERIQENQDQQNSAIDRFRSLAD